MEGLRGFAAIVIYLRHASDLTGFPLPSSHLAVDLFFVVSGFVLAHAYEDRFRRGMTPTAFMRLRLIRLYPLYLLSLAAAVAGVVFWRLYDGRSDWSASHLAQALLLNGLFLPDRGLYGEAYPLNLPAWSLFLELFVCGLFALTWRWLSDRLLLAVVLVNAVALVFCAAHFGSLSLGWDWKTFWGGFPRVLFSFPLGVLIYRRLSQGSAGPLGAWLAPALVIFLLVFSPGRFQATYELACVLVLLPLLVVLAAKAEVGRGLTRLFGFVGATSYALYVLHVPALAFVKHALLYRPATPVSVTLVLALVLVALLLAASWAVDRFYDAPLRAWLGRRARSPRQARR